MNKYISKTISVILTVILVLSCVPAYATDTTQSDNSQVYELLTAFGIISDTDMIYYENIISRSIFVKYAVRCAGLSVSAADALPEGVFTDVDESTEGYDEIILARKMKLVSDAEFFNPDRNITRSEAAKIMVTMLGYGADAEYRGGYPNGYLILADSLDIFDSVNFEPDGSIDVNNYVTMLLNTLEAKPLSIFEITEDDGEFYSVGVEGDKPFMTQSLGIHKTTGIVSSNAYASLTGSSKVGDGQIMINGSRFLANHVDALDYFGMNVDAYYKIDDKTEKRTIVYLKELNNRVVTVLSEDIDLNGTTSREFSYYNSNDKLEKVKGLTSLVFVYNGGIKGVTEADLQPQNGVVTLIDNNDDGKYDVIKSTNYRTVLVSSTSNLSYTVTDSLGGDKLDLDVLKGDFDVIIEKDGKIVDFSAISKDDIISYGDVSMPSSGDPGAPASGKIIKLVHISSKRAQGKIESVSRNTLTIGGIEYNASQSIIDSVSAGEEGIFYIDMYNRIVAKKSIRDMVYGYIKEKAASNNGLNNGYLLKIFTENDRWVELKLAKSVKLVKTDGTLITANSQEAYGEIAAGQLVKYKVNADAEIIEVHLAQDIYTFSSGEDEAIANDVFRKSMVVCSGASDSSSYRSTVKSFGSKVGLKDDTKIFVIPDPGYSTNDEDFMVIGPSSLKADTAYYNITAYDVDKSVQAGACVMISESGKNIINAVDGESNLMVVTSIGNAISDNGDQVYSLNGAYSGDTKAVLRMNPDVEVKDYGASISGSASSVLALQPGDVLQLAFDSNGYVAKVERYYNVTNQGTTSYCSTSNEYNTQSKMRGTVSRVSHDDYRIVFSTPEATNGVYSTANLNRVYIYDKKRNMVSLGTSADIEVGDYIVTYVRQFSLREAVIIK